MSDLPDGWEWTTLSEIADTTLGKMLDRGKSTGRNLVPYLRNLNVQWGRFDLNDVSTMEIPPDQQAYFKVESGDLLVCEGGEIGRCAIWPGGAGYMAFQKALHRVRPFEGIEARYLRYLLEYLSATEGLASLATGSTIKHLPQQQLRRLPVPLAPTNEQRRIVTALEDHFSRIDSSDRSLSLASKRVRALRASILTAAVEDEVAGCPRFRLDELSYDSGYGTSLKCSQDGAGIPVLRIPNIQNGTIDLGDLKRVIDPSVKLDDLYVREGDVLFVRTNGSRDLIGRTAVVRNDLDMAFASYLIRFRLRVDLVLPEWVQLVTQSPRCRRYLESMAASSAGQYNLSISKLSTVEIPVPPIDEQRRILDISTDRLAAVFRLQSTIRMAYLRKDQLRRSLLDEAISGRLVPQDMNDEPASDLLDRIRSKRQTVSQAKRVRRPARKPIENSSPQETLL